MLRLFGGIRRICRTRALSACRRGQEAGEVDDEYRRSHGLAARGETDTAEIPLEADFPLSPRFAPAVAFYLASMLIADENPELSDTLFDRFCDAMATIKASIPSVKCAIRNVYPAS